MPLLALAFIVAGLIGWWYLGADVQARITLLAGLLLVACGVAVVAALVHFDAEDRGRVLPRRGWEPRR